MNGNDAKWMEAAIEQARKALELSEVPIGAVVVCKDRIVGTGHNMTESLDDPTAHAEMIAMTAACNTIGGKYLTDCTLYVTVEPCGMCACAMNWAQLGRLVYAAPDTKRGYTLYTPSLIHPRTKVETADPLTCQRCSEIVKAFFSRQR